MILYKYLSAKRAEQVLMNGTLHFSLPRHFNDPFDTPIVPQEPVIDVTTHLFGKLRAGVKGLMWQTSTGICSLTRAPANMLMWAHYADSHQGMVIGVDCEAAGFLDTETNMVPAHFGSVIYSKKRVVGGYATKVMEPTAIGSTFNFQLANYERLQRLFLMKSLDWAYEEEVRVVKCVRGLKEESATNQSGTFTVVENGGDPFYFYHLPPDCIREIYLGVRYDASDLDLYRKKYEQSSFSRAMLVHDSYELKFEQF